MPEARKRSRLLEFALIFAIAYLLSQVLMRYFFPTPDPSRDPSGFLFKMQDETVRQGNDPVVLIENGTDQEYRFPPRCPMPPFDVFRVTGEGTGEKLERLETTETALPCTETPPVPKDSEASIPLAPWRYSLFWEPGTYELELFEPPPPPSSGTGTRVGTGTSTDTDVTAPPHKGVRFTIHEPGGFVKLYRAFITKPFLNFLVFVASLTPGYNIGIGIIILTILVKLILFYPTQKSLEGQKKMQLLQPKLEEIRKKYQGDQQKQQQETLRLWKEHKINPFSSCLPILLQIPILIGLFHVIRDNSSIELSRHLLYPFFEDVTWSFNSNFLGLDLTKPNLWLFPPLLMVLQFVQMKLSFHIADKKKAAQIEKVEQSKVHTPEKTAIETQQKVMTYVLPLMIGFFAIQFPSAVSLYWGVSTLFAIGQQMIVNREHLRV